VAGNAKRGTEDRLGRVNTLPNWISLARLMLALAVFASLLGGAFAVALAAFLLAASTDWVDGYIARRFDLTSQLGRVFDPLVDKILICGTFVFLASSPGSGLPAWVAVIVVVRELTVTSIRAHLEMLGHDFSARTSGKWKMVTQCVLGALCLFALYFHSRPDANLQTVWYGAKGGAAWLRLSLNISVWATASLTIYSGWMYTVSAVAILRHRQPG